MNTYPSYKDSGVEWIGEIPSGWSILKTKYMTLPRKELSINGKEKLLSVSEYYGVIPRNNIQKEGLNLSRSESLVGYLKVYKGDLVNNIMLMWKKGLGVSQYNGIVSPSYSVFEFVKSIPSYYHYLFRTERYITEFRKNSTGVIMSRLRLYDDDFGDIPSIVPPLQEQQQISDYLDYKTSKIDTLIEKTQQKIELLKEQRTSLINTTVTKGLNPSVEMKDSGVEWIGEIPSEWDVKKLTYITKMIGSGTTPKSNNKLFYKNGTVPWLVTGDLNDGYIKNTSNKITEKAIKEHTSLKIYPKNSVSIAMYGATIGKLGILTEPVTVNQANCVFVFDEKNIPKFWFYVLLGYRNEIISLGYGGGQPNISQDVLKSLRFVCPDYKEQQRIVDYLDKETSKIDKLVDIESKRIILLKEYRQSLISDVVTGKVDVRDEVLV